ncbi:alpha/beta hydrolase family protein [Robiginitalea sp. IMCC43444]|uniref:alpha/beta hydrolase family protein n=1 Tax=Robiginitalea sp. IMCC43444 TaxID=3459121 RepID=UPI0040428FDC
MKKSILVLFVLSTALAWTQEISGEWNGVLKVQGLQLRLVFNIQQTEDGTYSATMDSPDQGAKGIPVDETIFVNDSLKLSILRAGIRYEGILTEQQEITGTFKQAGQSLPLDLRREIIEKTPVIRPQEPKEPYPYRSEDVTFENPEAGITLAGTLTLPVSGENFPAAILISGSGPQDRDESLLGHKPFLILSDHLTRSGIAVLRYDDRGTASSGGEFSSSTSLDFASDAEAALAYLKTRTEIDHSRLGLIGHSEGGLIAPMVAISSKEVSFVVLLAGPGVSGYDILLQQTELILRADGMETTKVQAELNLLQGALDIIVNSREANALQPELNKYYLQKLEENPTQVPEGMTAETLAQTYASRLGTVWMRYFLSYDPSPALEQISCPVLALNGSKDLQVPATQNLNAIRNALQKGGNKNITVKSMDNLNHLFQEAKTGSPSEYAAIEQTFSPVALEVISDWIIKSIN